MTLSAMIGKLQQSEKRSGLVFRNNKYIGLIENKRLLKTNIDSSKIKIGQFAHNTPLLNEHADIIETAYLMYQSNLDLLPVERNKKIIGVLNALDLVKIASALPEAKNFKVADIKLVKPRKIEKNDPLAMAIDVMYQERLEQVPIYEHGKLYGIISFRDLLRRYLNWSPRREVSAKFSKLASSRSAQVDMPKLANLPVSSFSSNDNLLTISKNISLKQAASLMTANCVSDLLVTTTSGVEGLLTVKNILRKIGSLKIPKNFNIQFIDLNRVNLEPYQKYNLMKIASNESFKLQRKINNQFSLIIHIKEYSKEGSQHKFSVNLRIEFPGRIITSTQEDWDIETAFRKTFNNAKNELKKKFRGDTSWKKNY